MRLEKIGLTYPYYEILDHGDDTFSNALLSRYPLKSFSTFSEEKGLLDRGLLDVLIEFPNGWKLQFLGVHLKSKAGSGNYDEQREREALWVREYIHHLWNSGAGKELLVFGDFNDAPRSPTLMTFRDENQLGEGLKLLELLDSRGEAWTHYYKQEEVYSQIDYLFCSPYFLKKTSRKRNGRVVEWSKKGEPSDHRPLILEVLK